MKILHVCRGMANQSGVTYVVRSLTEHEAYLGPHVTVAYVERPGQTALLPDPEIVRSLEFPLSLPLMNPGISLRWWREVDEIVTEVDVVHVHAIWNFVTLATIRACHRVGTPVIVAPHGSLDPWALQFRAWRKGWYARHVELPTLMKADAFQALTGKEAGQIRQSGFKGSVEIIPNGISLGDFSCLPDQRSSRQSLGLAEDAKVLLFLGRVHPKKGLEFLADLIQPLKAEVPSLVVLVAGSDGGTGYMEKVKRLFSQKDLGDTVRFVGEVSGQRKLEVLAAADVFTLPSHSEGLPMAVLEALASGLPVVISENCNIPEVARAEAGEVLPLDSNKFREGLLRQLAQDNGSRQSTRENAHRLVRDVFSWNRIAEQTLRAYMNIVARRALK